MSFSFPGEIFPLTGLTRALVCLASSLDLVSVQRFPSNPLERTFVLAGGGDIFFPSFPLIHLFLFPAVSWGLFGLVRFCWPSFILLRALPSLKALPLPSSRFPVV